jgi:SP family general alpha glucoside:H+ symporter-like MFS transporter
MGVQQLTMADRAKVTGYGVERFGYRPFILGILFYQCIVTVTFFVAPSIEILLLAECLAGIAFGVFMSGTSITPES